MSKLSSSTPGAGSTKSQGSDPIESQQGSRLKGVGVYERPTGLSRFGNPMIAIIGIILAVLLAFLAYRFLF